MSATSTVWLLDENGNRIPGTDKMLAFDLTTDWRIEAPGYYWRADRDVTVIGFEIAAFGQTFFYEGEPVTLHKRDVLTDTLWISIHPKERDSALLDYLRDRITIDEYEQRIDEREQATSAGIPSDAVE